MTTAPGPTANAGPGIPKEYSMTEIPAAFAHTCAEFLKTKANENGLDVHVSTQPPIVAGPYTTEPFECPHGTAYWIEPTGEWIAWAVENGVE